MPLRLLLFSKKKKKKEEEEETRRTEVDLLLPTCSCLFLVAVLGIRNLLSFVGIGRRLSEEKLRCCVDLNPACEAPCRVYFGRRA